jgi:hypothetical protein
MGARTQYPVIYNGDGWIPFFTPHEYSPSFFDLKSMAIREVFGGIALRDKQSMCRNESPDIEPEAIDRF